MIKDKEKLCLIMSALGFSNAKQRNVLDFETIDELVESRQIKNILSKDELAALNNAVAEKKWENILTECEQNDVAAITFYSQSYPQQLKEIPDPPIALFVKGNISLLKEKAIAVVGTRKITPYGKKVTTLFTKELAKDFVIISGLAYGVDTVAHEATLSAGGKTIAVLGSGVCNIYPKTNFNLAQRIVDAGGAIVSEFGIFSEPLNYHFPMRNRIVSGLSCGLLITEAPLKSGTMSTLEHALEQGKDVFAVPGEIYSQSSAGCNEILKRLQGALVTTPSDITQSYGIYYEKPKSKQIQLDFSEQAVVNLLSHGKVHFDEIVTQSKIPPSELSYILATLELKGIISKLPGNYYQYMEDNW